MVRAYLRSLVRWPQLRRFVTVGAFTALIQMALLWTFVDAIGLNYLVGATIAIEITIILSYVLNNAWTFQRSQNAGTRAYLIGLVKTNLVRGSAIPIQLTALFLLVDVAGVLYLPANVFAILLSGIYRYVLDARWTWGGT